MVLEGSKYIFLKFYFKWVLLNCDVILYTGQKLLTTDLFTCILIIWIVTWFVLDVLGPSAIKILLFDRFVENCVQYFKLHVC